MLADARRGHFDVVLVWACDRLARSVRHFLEVLDELNRLNVEFVSFREQLDTGGPLSRAVVVIISAIAELERSLIVERVRAGMRRARLEGRHIGHRPLDIDHNAVLRQRIHGQSISQIAKTFSISWASVSRILKQAQPACPKGSLQTHPQVQENSQPEIACFHERHLLSHLLFASR
jgi:DNA invertase Pin-like site-specific DNA recombinase